MIITDRKSRKVYFNHELGMMWGCFIDDLQRSVLSRVMKNILHVLVCE